MMRCIDHPTMVKDGSGWGAMAGVTAAIFAREGFTGAPALTVESDEVKTLWSDLGRRWRIREQYFKAYPVCRWAQPAVEAALSLKRAHRFDVRDIVAIGIESFREAIDLGSQCGMPATTDEAQYSLPFPVAAALVFGTVGAAEIGATGLGDARVARLLATFSLREEGEFSRRFPAERWARVRIGLADGRSLVSEATQARGGAEHPLSDDELAVKYRALATPVLGATRTARIESLVSSLATDAAAPAKLVDELLAPVE
jgi:2-methylcitrate dehydratase PrpD